MSTQLDLFAGPSAAVISECGRYRYELTRIWDTAGPLIEFIMLNPSTADGTVDDATIRRIVGTEKKPGFARRWGYGRAVVRNLFAWRATNPEELVNLDDPVGPLNREHLSRNDADCTIVAWGAHPAAVGWWNGYPFGWQRTVIQRPRLYCLGTNANGSPKHPLYVRANNHADALDGDRMIRWLLSAAALGTIVGVALAVFGPNAALGVAVCALAVIVWFGVKAARADRRRARDYRERVWQRRIDEAQTANPHLTFIKGGKEPDWLADLKPWPIGDDEVRR